MDHVTSKIIFSYRSLPFLVLYSDRYSYKEYAASPLFSTAFGLVSARSCHHQARTIPFYSILPHLAE